jgi:outer membrane protein OmpA-like peptidoglycan-associated protein
MRWTTKAIAATQKAEEGQQLAQNNQTKIVSVENNFNQKLSNLDSYKSVDTSSINFTLNSAELNDEAKATLDQLASKVKNSKGYVLEIEGFTDKTGNDSHNLGLSQGRSESVVRYLSQQLQIPLFRMFILGLAPARKWRTTKRGKAVQPIAGWRSRCSRASWRVLPVALLKSRIARKTSSGTPPGGLVETSFGVERLARSPFFSSLRTRLS